MYMVTKWYGTFLINEQGEVEKSILFPKIASEINDRLKAISKNEILDEERELVKGHENIENMIVSDERIKEIFRFDVEFNPGLPAPPPEDFGFDLGLLQQATLLRSKEQLVEGITPDKHIIHAINSINELTLTANLLTERLREWYGLHWPELVGKVDDVSFVKLILEHGTREEITNSEDVLDVPPTLGGDINESDLNAIRSLAKVLNDIHTERESLEKYAKTQVEREAPNTAKVAGPLITAKLIALTGGMERLSKVSASTIQLLGAEKALFRHLKDGSAPPKHGIIFQHPYLHSAPYWQRGKIARALATKISIAIRVDFFKGVYKGDELERNLKARIDEIRKRYPSAPKKNRWEQPKKVVKKKGRR